MGKIRWCRNIRVYCGRVFCFSVFLPLVLLLWVLLFFADAETAFAADTLEDGNYAVELSMEGGSGKASVETPALMTAEDGQYYARIVWSSPNYDYMVVDGERYDNQAGEGENSVFRIPIPAFDRDVEVIADTLAMGEPHEITYLFHFYADSIADESTLPQEGAKRVLMMAAAIIIAGGVLDYFVNKKRKRDYIG